jgi:hypothetical protein
MKQNAIQLTPLDEEPRDGLPTQEAAAHLNRRPQTLRIWACYENGPIKPRRINGRLFWRVVDLQDLLQGVPNA